MATAAPTKPAKPLTAAQIAGDTAARWAWICENLRIIDKAGQERPLAPNRGQQHIIAAIRAQESAGLPVRIILLKARQFGGSTAIQADIFARCYLLENRSAFTQAHESEASANLFRMTKDYHTLMPAEGRLPTAAANGYELSFAKPHGGRMRIATAGSPDAARSGTYQFAHLSEIPQWPDQDRALQAIMAAIPDQAGTAVFKESTAKGVGNRFHQDWLDACKAWQAGDMTWIPVFVGWLSIEEYRAAVPQWYDWDSAPADVMEDEPELRQLNATLEQLYWRRRKIAGDFAGNVDGFREEFPSTPDEAFVASGRPAISASIISHHRRTCQPGRKCRLVLDPMVDGGVRAEYDESLPEPFWRVWRPPFEQGDYAIGGDVAEGGLSDPRSSGSKPDRSACLVFERATLEDAAEWIGRIEADLFGLELLKAAMWFNRGWVTPEANAAGMAALLVLKRAHYPRIMQRVADIDKISGKPIMAEGWKTTTANREQMIDDMIAHIRPKPGGDYEGQMVIHSSEFLDECGTFVHAGARGKREHMPGKHDDTIFARAVALQIHLNCPRMFLPQVVLPRIGRQTWRELNYAGAADYGPFREGRGVGGAGFPEETR